MSRKAELIAEIEREAYELGYLEGKDFGLRQPRETLEGKVDRLLRAVFGEEKV